MNCKRCNSVINAVNQIDSRIFIFLILCCYLLSFIVQSNEEAYFALAKQYVDPSWIPGSFTLTEWVGTRFLFQTIAGYALQWLSFEQLSFFGRMFNFLLYAFPLALIFKELKINNIGILIFLSIFLLNTNIQAFIGDEWIFKGFEAKTLAYVLVFYGYYYLLKGKYVLTALFAALASYFHILVGGWFFVLVFLYVVFKTLNFKEICKSGLMYLLIISPFIIYLATNLSKSGSVINGIDIDWVSVFFRNPHHTAPLHTGDTSRIILRIITCSLFFLSGIFYFRKSADENIRKLNLLAMIALCMIFAGLVISFIDVNGRILKYYLFRIASIGAFSYYLLLLLFIRSIFRKKYKPLTINIISLIVGIALFLVCVGNNIKKQYTVYQNNTNDLTELANYCENNSTPDAVYLFLDCEDSFSRKARRDVFVMYKFDPGGGEKIYEWYMRVLAERKLSEDISYIDTLSSHYKIDYLVAEKEISYENLKEVYHNHKYYVYEVVTSKSM